ncbi:OLC1v1018847C2 [Oldenlandia corymbosa var. corymbosa]|nr:OLC1v1018847C2 [Oldenlandia corymbosa var. corymbosa]
MDIIDSVLAHLAVVYGFPRCFSGFLEEPVEALKGSVRFLRNFIRLATIPGTDELQELPAFLTHIEAQAIDAAHVTMRLFSDISDDSYHERTKLMISALLHKITHVDSHVYVTYTRVLASKRHSIRELHFPTLNTPGDPIIIIEEFVVYFLSNLWDILQLDTCPSDSAKEHLQALYEGLRFLRSTLKENPNKFLETTIRDLVGVVICDTGILIFSLYQNDVETDLLVLDLLKNIQVILAEVEEQVLQTSEFSFPRTNVLGFLDSLLDDLLEVKSRKVDSDTESPIGRMEQHLLFLRSVLEKLVGLQNQHEELQALYNLALGVAYKMEFLIDQLVLGNVKDSFTASFESVSEDIKIIETDAANISSFSNQSIQHQRITLPLENSTATTDEVVGFETEITTIIDRLTRGSKKLQVVAIVGMPGSGKTTLASKVFNNVSVTYHFNVRAWCSVSQILNVKKVLLDLLTQTLGNLSDGYLQKAEPDLAQELWRSLKRRRYLIFLDDVWETQAFDCIKESFPDDLTESRILLTSRQRDVVPITLRDENPLSLRLLSGNESLELLRRKLLPWKDCTASLYEIVSEIAKCCKGLPLTIVIVAGILSTTKQEAWNEVLESLRSGIISGSEQCNNVIELSYRYLPYHLKSCLLFLGIFPEDHEVSVKRLIWYWIGEGFIQKTKSKSLEEVATDYLNNLIGRSLVMEAKKSSRGDVKACRIHDLLHDFCRRKAKEEVFFQLLKGENELLSLHRPGNLQRLCINSSQEQFKESKLFCPRLRSLVFYDHLNPRCYGILDMSFIFRIFKLLKVLDIEDVKISFGFPSEIGLLVQLRFLAIQASGSVSASIGNLSNLEIFIVHVVGADCVSLPETFWNLQKLRHLYTTNGDGIELPVNNLDSSSDLLELVSLSTISSKDWSTMKKVLQKFPNIRRLRCAHDAYEGDLNTGWNRMTYSFMSRLESLRVSIWCDSANYVDFVFPENLKKLTLELLPWEKIATVAQLPHLQVLKLIDDSFIEETWNVEEGQFPKLRFLELQYLDIVKWIVSDDYEFPCLQKLVLSEFGRDPY